MRPRPLPAAVLIGVVVTILALTLAPDPTAIERLPVGCLYCSERATADVIANIILFLPLGAALAWAGARRVWAWGLALTLGIELAQQWIPGRDPALGDVITNTLGTQLGWTLSRHIVAEWRRAPRASAGYVAGAVVVAITAVVVWLLGPAPTDARYYAAWTPVRGNFAWYRAQVLGATVNRAALTVGELAHRASVDSVILGHGTLHVRAVAGPPVAALAPLVIVNDHEQREILLLGPDRDALVLRYRHRAATLRFDEPDVRLEGAFAGVRAGDTTDFGAERRGRYACLALGGRRDCLPTATPGRGWSLVMYAEQFPAWFRAALDAMWVGGLALLVGWYAGPRRSLIGGAVLMGVALLLVPLLGTIAVSSPIELLAAAGALALGAWLRRLSADQSPG
jgi:hypothetical protein